MADEEQQAGLDRYEGNGNSGRTAIEIRNLIVAPMARVQTMVSDVESLLRIAEWEGNRLKTIVWNEESITLVADATRELRYVPELNPTVAMFFERDQKREPGELFQKGVRIWEGDYEPVKFAKRRLIQYLKQHATVFDPEVQDAVRQLKVTKTEKLEAMMLDEDSDDESSMKERTNTNLPKRFRATIPLADGLTESLEFEAEPVKAKNDYGREVDKYVIQVRCLNAREALRSMMSKILERLPADVPRLYGRVRVVDGNRGN